MQADYGHVRSLAAVFLCVPLDHTGLHVYMYICLLCGSSEPLQPISVLHSAVDCNGCIAPQIVEGYCISLGPDALWAH